MIRTVTIMDRKKLIRKDVLTLFNPNSGTDMYLAIIKFFKAIKKIINEIKFLCSE